MSRLEDELKNALRREEPPAGFAERVLTRAAAPKRRWSFTGLFGTRGVRWALAGALTLVLAGAGLEYRQHEEERARGEAARAQLMLALRITGTKLQFAQAKVQGLQGSPNRSTNTETSQ